MTYHGMLNVAWSVRTPTAGSIRPTVKIQGSFMLAMRMYFMRTVHIDCQQQNN